MSRASSKRGAVLGAVGVIVVGLTVSLSAITITNYLWFFPQVNTTAVRARADAAPLITRLRTEVQRWLDAGRPGGVYAGLGIGEFTHNDQGQSDATMQYWTSVKPGRMIATAAWVYPYATSAQQTALRAYVQAELASATYQPWNTTQLGTAAGNPREFYPHVTRTFGNYANWPTYFPAAEQMYGLWLWGWRIGGDWSDLTPYQSAIRTWYTNTVSAQGTFYGGMGVHIAKARLESSTIWNNSGNQTTATNNLQTVMDNGLNFGTTEALVSNCTTGLFRMHWCGGGGTADTRRVNGQYPGWVFLGVAPEVARYLGTETFTNPSGGALAKHTEGKTKYPLWWLRQAGYDNGDACDNTVNCEGSGISPENICLIAPLEMYAVNASAATLRGYTKSSPVQIGEPCWLELLVYAIEATGPRTWVDTRLGPP